jgi:hypothetical protein
MVLEGLKRVSTPDDSWNAGPKGQGFQKGADMEPLSARDIDEATIDDFNKVDINNAVNALKETETGLTEDAIEKLAAQEGEAMTLGGRQKSEQRAKAGDEAKLDEILSAPEYMDNDKAA